MSESIFLKLGNFEDNCTSPQHWKEGANEGPSPGTSDISLLPPPTLPPISPLLKLVLLKPCFSGLCEGKLPIRVTRFLSVLRYFLSECHVRKLFLVSGGRYSHRVDPYPDGYSSPYDNNQFHTVPNSVQMPDHHWSTSATSNNHTDIQHMPHPAFIHASRGDTMSYPMNGDAKSLLQPGMISAYTG